MTPRPKAKKVIEIREDGTTEIQNWAILGLDLSLSNTGFASLYLQDGAAVWGHVGSLCTKTGPENWARSQAYGIGIGMVMESMWKTCAASGRAWGLCISLEWPDPNNSYLMGLNQVVQSVIWNYQVPFFSEFQGIQRMSVNASTLRSVVGIKGGTDKEENHRIAQSFLPPGSYPNLDHDACDAVLLCQFARWGVDMLQGRRATVPVPAQIALAKVGEKMRVVGSRRVPVPAGILYDPVLWTRMEIPTSIILKRRDAATKSARLDQYPITI